MSNTRQITVQEAQIHLIDRGSGPPVLLLHGNPDTSELWGPIIAGLSGSYRCIAPDLPGYGRSTIPTGFEYTLDGMAGFVDAFVTALHLAEPVTLVVHDIGGLFGLPWVVRYPHRVAQVIILNTAFSPDYRWTRLHKIWRTPVLGEFAQRMTSRRALGRELRKGTSKLTESQVDQIHDRITEEMKRMPLRIFRSIQLDDFKDWDERLRTLLARIPSLVIWSDGDPYIGPEFAELFSAQTVRHHSGYGHWLPLEAPATVVDEVKTFLDATRKLNEAGARPAQSQGPAGRDDGVEA